MNALQALQEFVWNIGQHVGNGLFERFVSHTVKFSAEAVCQMVGYAGSVQNVDVLIPAAGSGERLGRGPKAFLPLGETTILGQTLKAFKNFRVTVAVSADMWGAAQAYVGERVQIIEGGSSRQRSVFELLKVSGAETVLIHDAARPFLAFEVIDQSVQAAMRCGAASVVKSVADTLITETGEALDRARLRAVQTPQTFQRGLIMWAHEEALAKGIKATDDAALVRLLGHEVALVRGDAWLDKITSPADYERAQALVALWEKADAS